MTCQCNWAYEGVGTAKTALGFSPPPAVLGVNEFVGIASTMGTTVPYSFSLLSPFLYYPPHPRFFVQKWGCYLRGCVSVTTAR